MPALSGPRRKLESFMTDAIIFRWDREGSADDTIDYDTGEPVSPAADTATVYDHTSVGVVSGRSLAHSGGYGGKCFIDPQDAVRSVALQIAGGARVTATPYQIEVPIDAPEIGPGAVGECVYSKEDPGLVGKTFTVRTWTGGTLEAIRVLVCEERGTRLPD